MNQPTLRLNDGYPDSSPHLRDAVKALQRELQRWGYQVKPDGYYGQSTLLAVKSFQLKQGLKDDGIVGPKTWRLLGSPEATNIGSSFSPSVPPYTPVKGTGEGTFFPLARVYSESWAKGAGTFGANRKGPRAHAGCDLYAPKGTWIHAVTAGTVIYGPRPFYCETYEIAVHHGDFVIRYGEVQRDSPVREGDKVQAGQRIARVGHLVGIKVPSDMLHLEMYSGKARGALTDRSAQSAKRSDGVSFQRRSDLMNPTSHVEAWRKNLPVD